MKMLLHGNFLFFFAYGCNNGNVGLDDPRSYHSSCFVGLIAKMSLSEEVALFSFC